jgi:hypothetical protein
MIGRAHEFLLGGIEVPRGPKGEKRPADVNARAVMIAKIATGEVDEISPPASGRAKGGKLGGKARAATLTPGQRAEIASVAAQARWKKS